jgi:hypothetical protein
LFGPFLENEKKELNLQSDHIVELGPDAPALEVPWASASGDLRFFDLRRQPELLLELREATQNRELATFLAAINNQRSRLQSAKCDTWITDELTEDEDVFEARWKFGSYVDLIFIAETDQVEFSLHESTAKNLSDLLRRAPEISAAAEFVVRRCYFRRSADLDESEDGYCITFYLYGYGDDEDQSRRRWALALEVVQNAVFQVTQSS